MFSRRAMLTHHLQYNHYPPVRADEPMIDACERAIDLLADETDAMVRLPDYAGKAETLASDIVDALHLDSFVQDARDDIAAEQDRLAEEEYVPLTLAGVVVAVQRRVDID